MGNQHAKLMSDNQTDTLRSDDKYYNKPKCDFYNYNQKNNARNLYICKLFSNAIHNRNLNAIDRLIITHHSVLTKLCCYVPLYHLLEANLIPQAIHLCSRLDDYYLQTLLTPQLHGSLCGTPSSNKYQQCNSVPYSPPNRKDYKNLGCYSAWLPQSKTYMFDLQQYVFDHKLTTVAEALLARITKFSGNSNHINAFPRLKL